VLALHGWLDNSAPDERWDQKITIFNGKTMGKPWENHGKTMGKPWENGDLYGKIHHAING